MQTMTIDKKPMARVKTHGAQALEDASETAAYDAWFRAQVAQGLAEANDPAIAWVTHEQAQASWSRKRAELAKQVGGAV